MPVVLNLTSSDDPRDVVHRAVQAIAEGKLVAFPTETVYCIAASGLHVQAVERLRAIAQQPAGIAYALAIKSAEDAQDYVPRLSAFAERLSRRCWPGPVTLVLDDNHPDSLLQQLPGPVQRTVAVSGAVAFRVPAHVMMLDVLRLTAGPLVTISAARPGQTPCSTGEQVNAMLGADIDLLIDDGETKFGQQPSIVRVTHDAILTLETGVLNNAALKRLASFVMLFVCTGNTCRSPMAETLMKGRIAKHLNCAPGDLDERGILILSAGISAGAGSRASVEAVNAMAERKLDLRLHESQPVTDRLVRFADLMLTMTKNHYNAIAQHWPQSTSRLHLVSRDRGDVADPIGGPLEFYRKCAEQIDGYLESWMTELIDSRAFDQPKWSN